MVTLRLLYNRRNHFPVWAFLLLLVAGCAGRPSVPLRPPPEAPSGELALMGYTVQVGAFAQAENAYRLTDVLHSRGLDATYFVAEKGLYKVRFGNFPSRAVALEKAQSLRSTKVIDEFYIVSPGEYAVAKREYGSPYLRGEIVKTARRFIGAPYLWRGTGADNGFDCSGLTMTVYQLNGLNLPRTSLEQASVGSPVERNRLAKGDLVFFQTTGNEKVSHVGIYMGNNLFLHAPGKGKKIRLDSLSDRFYQQHYAGARTYL